MMKMSIELLLGTYIDQTISNRVSNPKGDPYRHEEIYAEYHHDGIDPISSSFFSRVSSLHRESSFRSYETNEY